MVLRMTFFVLAAEIPCEWTFAKRLRMRWLGALSPMDFVGSHGKQNPCFFGRFPCFFTAKKKQGKEDQSLNSTPNMTGRPGCRTMEMNGGNSAPYLARTPCVPLFCTLFNRVETEGLLDYQGRAGIISIVRWNLRPVIFGVAELVLELISGCNR